MSVQEDWDADIAKNELLDTVKSELMEKREKHGLPLFVPKAEGLEAISYGTFYDSMFELADCMIGRGEHGMFENILFVNIFWWTHCLQPRSTLVLTSSVFVRRSD